LRFSAVFVLWIFIVSALPCTVLSFSTTHGRVPAEALRVPEITEDYVLSKNSDYRTNDRDYTRGEMLYVWAWSSRIDPNNVKEHYCQLTLGEHPPHILLLNYEPNLTPQYSYTGSLNLSWLEEIGDWEVQIVLKSKPPKPTIFEVSDVIHVSEVAPPEYSLTITTKVGGTTDPTPGSYRYSSGTVVAVRATPDSGFILDHWELDGVNVGASNTISITMNTHHALHAVFATPPPPSSPSPTSPPPTPPDMWQMAIPYILPIGLFALFGLTAYVVMERRTRMRKEIKEAEYIITLQDSKLEAMLQELDKLLQRRLISRETYEAMRREIEDELMRIRRLKS